MSDPLSNLYMTYHAGDQYLVMTGHVGKFFSFTTVIDHVLEQIEVCRVPVFFYIIAYLKQFQDCGEGEDCVNYKAGGDNPGGHQPLDHHQEDEDDEEDEEEEVDSDDDDEIANNVLNL